MATENPGMFWVRHCENEGCNRGKTHVGIFPTSVIRGKKA